MDHFRNKFFCLPLNIGSEVPEVARGELFREYSPQLVPATCCPRSPVFLGTAAIQPGKFNAIGAFIGIYFLQTGIVGLQLAGLTGFIEDLLYGGTLVVAVTISTIVRRRADH